MQNPTSSSPSIEISGLTVAFARELALDDVSVTVEPGLVTAVLGPSGCGKSTLLRAIAGLRQPTVGRVCFRTADHELERLPAGQLGYVFQDASLLPWRSALENVAIPLELLGTGTRAQQRKLAREQLAAVGLGLADSNKLPRELSGGMRMRVSIARALVSDPAVLLLDEPFSALDELLRRKLGELVLELWRTRQRTIVLVTHNIDEAILMSDHIIVMGDGKIAKRLELSRQWLTDEPRQDPQFGKLYRMIADALQESSR